MTSEELNDAYSAKLDGIIQFFVRERESKINYITFRKESNTSRYANFLAAIAIVAAIIYFLENAATAQKDDTVSLILLLIAGMLVVDIYMYWNNRQLDNEYNNAIHKFDVIINSLQVLKIVNQDKELSKLVCTMEKRPIEFGNKNKSYEDWLDNIYHCVKQLSTCD